MAKANFIQTKTVLLINKKLRKRFLIILQEEYRQTDKRLQTMLAKKMKLNSNNLAKNIQFLCYLISKNN